MPAVDRALTIMLIPVSLFVARARHAFLFLRHASIVEHMSGSSILPVARAPKRARRLQASAQRCAYQTETPR
jgi:hypothetical protein